MKRATRPRIMHHVKLAGLFVLPTMGFVFLGPWGILLGLLLAIVFDSDIFFPVWRTEISWQDLENVLTRLFEEARAGTGHLLMRFPDGHLLAIGKGYLCGQVCMGFLVPIDDWAAFLQIFDEASGRLLERRPQQWKGRETLSVALRGGVPDTLFFIRQFLERTGCELERDIDARIIWAPHSLWNRKTEKQ